MRCSDIANKIELLDPDADPRDVARVCTLLSSTVENCRLEDDDFFLNAWQEVNLRLAAASDQHAAVTQDLERLAESDPREFDKDKIWILIRANQDTKSSYSNVRR